MAEATLRLSRTWWGVGLGAQMQKEPWKITLDGATVGEIAVRETVEVAVVAGRHWLRLGEGRRRSAKRSFDVSEDEVVSFHCHGPRLWPLMLAAQVKPDLWITLRRS